MTDELNIFASFAQGFGVPELATILGFPPDGFRSLEDDLDVTAPQVVNNYELGIRGQWQAVQFSLAGFFNQSDLGTTFISDDDGIRRPVRAPERFYGVEAREKLAPVVAAYPRVLPVLDFNHKDNYDNSVAVAQQKWEDNPLLQKMRAVQAGRIRFVNDKLFGRTREGVIASKLVLARLPELLLPFVEEK